MQNALPGSGWVRVERMHKGNGRGRAAAVSQAAAGASASLQGGRPIPSRRIPRAPVAEPQDWLVARGPLLLAVFMASLMIPGIFTVGGMSLSPYRVILILAFVPLFLRWISGRTGPVTTADLAIFLYCGWIWIALFAVHGFDRVHTAGIQFAEMFGGYLIGRTLVRDSAGFRTFVRYSLIAVLFLLPFALVELLTGMSPLRMIFSPLMEVPDRAWIGFSPRLGFNERAQGPFPHPILLGLFCALAVANVYFLFRRRLVLRTGAIGLVLLTMLTSLSSAPLISAGLQLAMIAWDRLLFIFKARWVVLVIIGGAIVLFFQAFVEGGLVGFIIETLTFNPVTGEYRLDILHFGLLSVWNHPVFGIGFNDWERGFWMPHPTMDNFWLLIAVQYGIPALVLMVVSFVSNMARAVVNPDLDAEEQGQRSGYLFALVGLIVVLGTVTLWGAMSTFVLTYLGAGVWFGHRKELGEEERPGRRVRMPERRRFGQGQPPADGPARSSAAHVATGARPPGGFTRRQPGGTPGQIRPYPPRRTE